MGLVLLIVAVLAGIGWGIAQQRQAERQRIEAQQERERLAAESEQKLEENRQANERRLKEELGLRWMRIPSGSFTMGCTSGDGECAGNENPPHLVVISRDFALAETETTVSQYQACVLSGRCTALQGSQGGNDHPVGYMDWNQSKAFCEWAGGRLPSEAEWEYAARGGKEGWKYPWGNSISHENANYGRGTDGNGLALGRDRWVQTSPVKSFAANGYGLYDMSGNVEEWVSDPWHDGYLGAPSDGSPWNSGGSAWQGVERGGSWYDNPGYLRVSYRQSTVTGPRYEASGFRCARTEVP